MDDNQHSEDIMTFFKTLANLERLKIAGLISLQELTPPQIAERLGMKPVVVLKHLEQLVHSGLALEKISVASQEKQRGVSQSASYALDARYLQELSRRVLSGSQPKVQLDNFEGEDYDRKVLGDFLRPDGSLKSIPTQQRKLLAVLRYLAQEFVPGQRYPEKQVNIMLAVHYPDAATLRRYLVDNQLLKRTAGEYWREEE
jgi:hypothetical protein